MPDGELDFKTMFENSIRRLKDRISLETEYFEMLRKSSESAKYSNIASKHLLELKMEDQIMLLKTLVVYGECAKAICEKYGWTDEAEEVETE